MHLPVVSDREVVRQNLIADENEAIFAKMTVSGAIVGIFDQIMIGIGVHCQKSCKFGGVFDLFEIVAAMRSNRPGQNGWGGDHSLQHCYRKAGTGCLRYGFWNL